MFFFFFKQKTAYEMRISDWSSDVCSSDLLGKPVAVSAGAAERLLGVELLLDGRSPRQRIRRFPKGRLDRLLIGCDGFIALGLARPQVRFETSCIEQR